ncbi:MAG TPA: hypothetical protein VGE69_09075 [Pseudomonadales bacterium]
MNDHADTYSIREKNLWFEFLSDIAIALYYWPKAIPLMLAGDDALRSGAMANLIASTVVWAIVVTTALSIFLHTQRKPEPMDERDYLIAARGSHVAVRMLVACVLVVIGLIVFRELTDAAQLDVFPLSPLVIAHLLLVSLMLWSMTSTIIRLFCYRRGY